VAKKSKAGIPGFANQTFKHTAIFDIINLNQQKNGGVNA